MRILKRIIALTVALIFSICLGACKKQNGVLDFTCFNTDVHIESHGKGISDSTAKRIKDLFAELESEFDADEKDSLIYAFNGAQSGAVFNLSDHAFNILSAAKTVYTISDGDFDPTVYPLVKLWGFAPFRYTAAFTPPTATQITAELEKVNFDNAILDRENKTLTKADANIKLDLGGIVKGYAADLAANILKDAGHTDGYVNVGGSSLNLLSVNELGVRHPRENYGNAILTVKCSGLKDISVSTSGDYEKYYKTADGKTYCHIISPKTGYTADTGVASATLLGVPGAESDALTTAICLKNYDENNFDSSELITFLKKIISLYPQIGVFVVYQKNDQKLIFTNQTQTESFTLHDDGYTVVKI